MAADTLSLTPKEVAALAGATEKLVRNEIASGTITPRAERRGRAVRRRFDSNAVYYFTLLRRLSLPVPSEDRRALYRVLTEGLHSCGRWTRTRRGLRHADIVAVDTGPVREEFNRRMALYRRGLRRMESRREVLGGEPVFKGTRLAVRHIGGMLLRGVSRSDIRTDYPALSDDDVAFAAIFASMKPAPGRPVKALRLARAGDGR